MSKNKFKSGFVTIIGRPNVGKSTLMNHLIGQKIAITSSKAQTTRNRIQTVYTCEEGQIVFVDTSLKGLILKDVIPSQAKCNIFFRGYFDSPANLSFLS